MTADLPGESCERCGNPCECKIGSNEFREAAWEAWRGESSEPYTRAGSIVSHESFCAGWDAAASALIALGAAAERERLLAELGELRSTLTFVATTRLVDAVLWRDIEHVLGGQP